MTTFPYLKWVEIQDKTRKDKKIQKNAWYGKAFPGISDHFLWFVWSSCGLKNIMRDIVKKKNSDPLP